MLNLELSQNAALSFQRLKGIVVLRETNRLKYLVENIQNQLPLKTIKKPFQNISSLFGFSVLAVLWLISNSLIAKDVFENKNFDNPTIAQNEIKAHKIQWPLVYPDIYKAILKIGFQKNSGSFGLAFGAAAEFIWNQTLFGGLGYEFNQVPERLDFEGGKIHRIAIQSGAIFQIDDYGRHHILIHLRPGFSLLKSKDGNGSGMGLGLGLGYDFGLNSDFILSPELIYHWYPSISGSPHSLSGINFGLRLSFGR